MIKMATIPYPGAYNYAFGSIFQQLKLAWFIFFPGMLSAGSDQQSWQMKQFLVWNLTLRTQPKLDDF